MQNYHNEIKPIVHIIATLEQYILSTALHSYLHQAYEVYSHYGNIR